MSQESQEHRDDDFTDAIATIAVITLVVATVVYWLNGMPT